MSAHTTESVLAEFVRKRAANAPSTHITTMMAAALAEARNAVDEAVADSERYAAALAERYAKIAALTAERDEARRDHSAACLASDTEYDAVKAERDALRAELARVRPLAAFGAKILAEFQGDGERGDIDGSDVQEWAVDAGAMENIQRQTPCGEHCACQDFYGEDEMAECYLIKDWPLVQQLATTVTPSVDRATTETT